eukprot:s2903_g7.t1
MAQSLRQSGPGNASARSNSLGSLRRGGASAVPRLSLFLPREHGLENPPRTAAAMDNILNMMQVAWRQINAARGSTVKLANPEHNLLMSLESARDFMLGMLREPDPGRRHLEEVFGGDCSRIAQVRAILDAAKLSTRIICDNRVISCMNAVKSVESVLKKDCGAAVRLSEAQDKELKKMQERQMRFEARHLRGEFSPLKGGNARVGTSPFGLEQSGTTGEAYSRPRSASTSAIPGKGDDTLPSSDALRETWKVLRDAWESGSLFQGEEREAKNNDTGGGDDTSSSSDVPQEADDRAGKNNVTGPSNDIEDGISQTMEIPSLEKAAREDSGCHIWQEETMETVDPSGSCLHGDSSAECSAELQQDSMADNVESHQQPTEVSEASKVTETATRQGDEGIACLCQGQADQTETADQRQDHGIPTVPVVDAEAHEQVEATVETVEADGSESDEDVPMPENWGMQRQKRGSLIRPVQLPQHLLEHARLAGYGDNSCDVVEFQVAHHEEKIGIAFRILPPAGHLVVERITPGTPAEALHLPKGSRLLCVNGLHTGSIEADNFFNLMKQRPLQLLFLRPRGAPEAAAGVQLSG